MGYTPNPAILTLLFSVWLAISVNAAPSSPLLNPVYLPTGSAFSNQALCSSILLSVEAPNVDNLISGSNIVSVVNVDYDGTTLAVTNVVPYQTYQFSFPCNANLFADVYYVIGSSRVFIREFAYTSGICTTTTYGANTGNFFIKTNNVAIRRIEIDFVDRDCAIPVNQPIVTVTISVATSCDHASASNQNIFEPNADYSPATFNNDILPDAVFANNFFGCPYSYNLNQGQSITWQLDGTAAGYEGVSIRFIDFNLRNQDDYLIIYHGSTVSQTSKAYSFTGTFPPGSEEVYIEDSIITVQLITTTTVNNADKTTFTGFVAVYNWNSPCKKYTGVTTNNYVSYLPFDHIGCVGSVPSSLQTNFYYFPLALYGSTTRLIDYVFTEFDLPAGSSLSVRDITFASTSAFTPAISDINLYSQLSIGDFTIPSTSAFLPTTGLFARFLLSTSSGTRTGYGVALDVGYTTTTLVSSSVCNVIGGLSTAGGHFAFTYDTPSASSTFSCNNIDFSYGGLVFYLLRPDNTFSNSLISISITYNLPEQRVFIYDGPSRQSPQLTLLDATGVYSVTSTGSELLFVFEGTCPGGSCPTGTFQLSYTLATDLCHSSGKSLNQFPLATIGCPEGIQGTPTLESYWLISGEKFNSRAVNQQGIITVSFTFFDIGSNTLNIYDGDSIYEYINDIPVSNLHLVSTNNGNTIPRAYETTQPELLLELISIQDAFGFIAVYTIYNGQNPCTSSSAITLYTPTGTIFCDNAQDSNNVQTVSRWFINPNDGIVALGVSYFYYSGSNDDAVDANIALFAGSQDTDPQLGIISAAPTNNGYLYNDPYGNSNPTTFNYRASAILVKFSSATNPTFFSMSYATTAIQCTTSGITQTFTQQEFTFGCAGLSATARKQYVIAPTTPGNTITLDFLYFRLQKGEVLLKIYEGTSSAGTLKYTFTGHTIPPQIVIRSKSLFIDVDTSKTTSVSGGFEIHYYTQNFCEISKVIKVTAPTNNIACLPLREGVNSSVLIEPNLGPITFSWNILNFRGAWELYDGSTIYAPMLASGYGISLSSVLPFPQSYTSSGRTLLIVFINGQQQSSNTSAPLPSFGFSFTYTASKRSGVNENLESEAVSTFSNNVPINTPLGSSAWGPGVTTEYYIAPMSRGRINLTIKSLTLQQDDVILIYDGPSQEYPLLTPILIGPATLLTIPSIPVTNAESILIIVSTAKTSVSSDFTFYYSTVENPCTDSGISVNLNQKFGFFGCPNGVDNSIVNSKWAVVPNNGPVVLEFLFFSFEKDADFLSVYDGSSASPSELLGTYTGSNINDTTTFPTFKSTLDAFLVTVTTNGNVFSQGFFAKWSTTDPCFITNSNTVLTDQFGTFGCESGLANNIKSTWLIAPNNGTIILSFESVNLNSVIISGNYPNSITVYDGSDATAPVLAIVTGSIPPPSIISTQNSIFVVLQTGNSVVRSMGFIAEYRAIGNVDPCSSDQALILTSSAGTVQCNPFKNGVVSSWFITPLDGPITFTPTPLFVQKFNSGTPGDTLTFYDGYSQTDPVLLTVDSSLLFPTKTSTSEAVLVVLSANSGNVFGTGAFSFGYVTKSSPCFKSTSLTYTTLSGTIACSNIGNNIDSNYVINPTAANGPITIEFSSFNFAPDDYLTIIEGTSTSGTVRATYTGTVVPPNYISATDAVTIRIQTNSNTRSFGFSLNYVASNDPCTASAAIVYTDVTRSFGCSNIGNNVVSSWLITPGFGKSIDLALVSYSAPTAGTTITVYGGSSSSGTPITTLTSANTTALTRFNQDTGFTSLFVTLTSGTTGSGSFTFLYASGDNDVCLDSGNSVLQQESGTFGCFHQIENNIHSTWLIAPSSGDIISLVITLVTTGQGWDSTFDTINVYDGSTTSASPISPTLDGSVGKITATFPSTGATLLVVLDTDRDTRSAGFSATYNTASTNVCLLTLPTVSAALSLSTDNAINCGPLGNNVNNQITITSTASRIKFTPELIITELNQDFIIIYDGATTASTEIARYSGLIQNGATVLSSTNTALVVISTNAENPSQRVNLKFDGATNDPCIISGLTPTQYTADAGRFGCSQISPPNGATFTNTFVIAPTTTGQLIYLQFDDLYIPPGFGTIEVHEGSVTGPIIATATGFNLPAPITSTQSTLTLVLSVQATSSFFVSYSIVKKPVTGPVVSISASPVFSKALSSANPPNSGTDPSPTLRPSSTPSAAVREASRSPVPDPSFATIPSFQPFVEPTSTPTTSFTATKSSTPSISLSYTETRTATATPAATPSATRSSAFFNIRTRFNCNQTVEQCCTDFSSFWATLSVLNSQLLVAPKICQAVSSNTDSDTLVEVVFEQFGSNFHTVESILNDYWAKAGCGNQDPIGDGVCVPSTSSLATADWDDVYLLEVVEEEQYTTDLNTSAAVETTYNPIDSTYQPVFTSSGSAIYPFAIVLTIVLAFL